MKQVKHITSNTKVQPYSVIFSVGLLWLLVFSFTPSRAQPIVISEYYNASDQKDEWIELLVIDDQTSLVGYTLRDNNTAQTSWQDSIRFSNHGLWTNLRSGTIIVIWNRLISSTSSLNPIDTNASDGYIEVNAQLPGLFTGGNFGSSPSWAGPSLSIAGNGELIQIRNALGTHIHALGHRVTTGIDFNSLPNPKLNHATTSSSGESIRVNPGNNLSSYSGPSGTTLTTKSSSLITLGLPNKSTSDSTSNLLFWRSTRQPLFPSNTLLSLIANANFTQFTLAWNPCIDPFPSDSLTGYLIVRNTSNTFADPQDGITYTAGQLIGSAQVVNSVKGSTITNYVDVTTLPCGQTFYYKIFAYRFNTDNQGSSSSARGRAYSEIGTNVLSITRPNPIISQIDAY